MMSTDWILIEDTSAHNGTHDIDAIQAAQFYMRNTEPCHAIGVWKASNNHDEYVLIVGCHDFWEAVRFGGYIDADGKTHVAFHTQSRGSKKI